MKCRKSKGGLGKGGKGYVNRRKVKFPTGYEVRKRLDKGEK